MNTISVLQLAGWQDKELLLSICASTSLHRKEHGSGFRRKTVDPARLGEFRIEIQSPIDLNDRHRTGMEEAVTHCLIHRTLENPPKSEIDVTAQCWPADRTEQCAILLQVELR